MWAAQVQDSGLNGYRNAHIGVWGGIRPKTQVLIVIATRTPESGFPKATRAPLPTNSVNMKLEPLV